MLQILYLFSIGCAAFVDIIFLAGFEADHNSHWVNLMHIGSFAILFGINIWNSLLAGLLLIRSIPRHQFGKAQSTILPAFFSLSFSLTCLTLAAIFLQYPYHRLDSWGTEMLYQIVALATAMILYVVLLLILSPKATKVMNKMYLFEREAGIGEEISMKAPYNEELQMNQEYMQLRRKFAKLHGINMLVAMVCLGLLCYHVNYLAGRFSLPALPAVVQAAQESAQEAAANDL